MTISPRIVLNANARITPGDALADTSTQYVIGFVGSNLAASLPSGVDAPDEVYSREFTLAAGVTRALNMATMQIATVDATAPKNADGEAINLSLIHMLVFKLSAVTDAEATFGFRATSDTWAQPCDVKIDQVNGVVTMFWPDGVSATGLVNLIETGNDACDLTVQLWALGKSA